jgi:hypothetical protein
MQWLKRIASSRMIKTYSAYGEEPRFSLQNGATVPAPVAAVLIRNGWVKRCGDGLLPDDTQSYEALKP